MRIGIDARFYGHVGKGLGRYTAELIRHLERHARIGDVFVIFLRRENFDDYVPASPAFTKVLADYPWYSFQEQVCFPALLRRYRLDLVHFTHFNVPLLYRGCFVVTIHDLILLHFPTVRNTTRSRLTYGMKYLAYRAVISSAIGGAVTVFAVSDFVRDDLFRSFPKARGKTVVTYEGCVFPITGPDAGVSESSREHGILKPYFLYVGNAYPHKNLEAFIPLAGAFPSARFVLVGKEDHFYRELKKRVDDAGVGNIVFKGYVPDGELSVLYRDATAYVFPSLYEGFGLPPLEAMRCGTPVIAADRGSLPEILADGACYFDPDDPGSLKDRVRQILSDSGLRDRLSFAGRRRADQFSWDDMASSTLERYRRAVSGASRTEKRDECDS